MKLKPNDIHNLPGLVPQRDERLMHLLEEAVAGRVRLYFAAVPLGLCVPFDLDYRPDKHPVGEAAIRDAFEQAKAGSFPKMFTYQRGAWFVVSDDYIPLFAALAGLPDYVPCWVLGKPESELVKDVQGPIDPASVKSLLGFA
jgi:hypothetical protein